MAAEDEEFGEDKKVSTKIKTFLPSTLFGFLLLLENSASAVMWQVGERNRWFPFFCRRVKSTVNISWMDGAIHSPPFHPLPTDEKTIPNDPVSQTSNQSATIQSMSSGAIVIKRHFFYSSDTERAAMTGDTPHHMSGVCLFARAQHPSVRSFVGGSVGSWTAPPVVITETKEKSTSGNRTKQQQRYVSYTFKCDCLTAALTVQPTLPWFYLAGHVSANDAFVLLLGFVSESEFFSSLLVKWTNGDSGNEISSGNQFPSINKFGFYFHTNWGTIIGYLWGILQRGLCLIW